MSSRSSATRAASPRSANWRRGIRDGSSIVEGDALALDPAALTEAPRKIVANLPYNIATALLLRWLDRIGEYESLTLMFQREVAERLVAAPRSPAYGRLSVLVQWLCEPRILFDLPPRAFVPPPKVTSSVVSLTPRADPARPGRQARPRTRHRRRLRPAPQDAALEPEDAWACRSNRCSPPPASRRPPAPRSCRSPNSARWRALLNSTAIRRTSSTVMPGLVPGIHMDGRDKPGHDGKAIALHGTS